MSTKLDPRDTLEYVNASRTMRNEHPLMRYVDDGDEKTFPLAEAWAGRLFLQSVVTFRDNHGDNVAALDVAKIVRHGLVFGLPLTNNPNDTGIGFPMTQAAYDVLEERLEQTYLGAS